MEICCDLCGREFAAADYCHDLLDIPGAAEGSAAKGLGLAGGTVEDSVSAFESEALASMRERQAPAELHQAPIRPFAPRASATGHRDALAGYSRYLCSQCYHTLCEGALDDLQRQTAQSNALAAQTAAQEERAARLSRLLSLSEGASDTNAAKPNQDESSDRDAGRGTADLQPEGEEDTDALILQIMQEDEAIAKLEARAAEEGRSAPSPGGSRQETLRPVEPAEPVLQPLAQQPNSFTPDPFLSRALPFIPVSSAFRTVNGHRLYRKKNGVTVSYDEINAGLCDLALLVYLLGKKARASRAVRPPYRERVKLLPVLPNPVVLFLDEGRRSPQISCELFLTRPARLGVVGQMLTLKDQRVAAALTVLVGRLVDALLLCNAKSSSSVSVPAWAVDLSSADLETAYGGPDRGEVKAGEGDSVDGEGCTDDTTPLCRPKAQPSTPAKVKHSGGVSFPELNIEITKVDTLDLHGKDMYAVLSGNSVFIADRESPTWLEITRELLLLVECARAALE